MVAPRGPIPSQLDFNTVQRLWMVMLIVFVFLFLIGSAILWRRFPHQHIQKAATPRVLALKRYDLAPPNSLAVSQLDNNTACVDWPGKDSESYKVYIAGAQDMMNPELLTPIPRGNRFCINTAAGPLRYRWLAVSAVDALGQEGILSQPIRVKYPG